MQIEFDSSPLAGLLSKSYHPLQCEDVQESVKQAIGLGDEIMREIMRDWNGFQPDSAAEARAFGQQEGREEGLEEGRKEGREKGRKEGREKGRKEGLEEAREEVREKIRRIAQRMLNAGISDQDIETITQLNKDEITKLRNGEA